MGGDAGAACSTESVETACRYIGVYASGAQRGRGAEFDSRTGETMRIYVCPPWVAEFSTGEAVEIGEMGALLEMGTDFRPGGLDPWCRGVLRIVTCVRCKKSLHKCQGCRRSAVGWRAI